MCGIVGFLDPRRRLDPERASALLSSMAATMWARGPDASGVWFDPHAGIGFGHRRLSILDLSDRGAQPMASRDGRWVIAYNGEIYNHRDVARGLESAGVAFNGHSDTEVLVESIARCGLSATLDAIDGMYAFALWDRDRRELTLARDRLGEKPLCYGTLPSGAFVFGSTLDAIAAHPDFDRTIDRSALALFLRYKYVPTPFTIYSGMRKLEPGSIVTIGADGSVGGPTPYWSYFEAVEGPTFDGSAEEAVEHIDSLLRRSVRRRMVADVPVGAFLSGGIDSSAVVAAAQAESTRSVRTFTIGSSVDEFDESSEARAVAAHLGTEHTELIVSDRDALATVETIGATWDEPFGDSSQIPTRLVSQLARSEVTVALSGDGGDELFGGYNRYLWVPSIWRQMGRLPNSVRTLIAQPLRRMPPSWGDAGARVIPASRRPRMPGLKISKVAGVLDAPDPQTVFHRLVSHWQDPSELVPDGHEPPTVHTDPSRWPRTSDLVTHMAAIDAISYLPDDILTKVDRATMSVSLEGRVPLLDRELVEFAASLPTHLKLRGSVPKWPLRAVLERSVPSALIDRPKSGFGVPIDSWIRGPLRSWAEERVFSTTTTSFLEVDAVRRVWDDHQRGRRNGAYELWDVIMLAEWADHRGLAGAPNR